MRHALRRLRRAWRSGEAGQGLVEYTFIVGSISLVLVLAFVTTDIETATLALATDVASTIQP